jgi:16S rRNA processing protein RimM
MSIAFLAVGKVLRPHGVRGELLLETLTEFPGHLAEVETVYLGPEGEASPTPHPLRRARVQRDELILQLADCLDRDAADAYRGQLAFIRTEQAAPLPPGRYYHHQIISLTVITDDGEPLGPLTEILETGANDVYIVQTPTGELLLPALQSVIQAIDLEKKVMVVHLLEGLR